MKRVLVLCQIALLSGALFSCDDKLNFKKPAFSSQRVVLKTVRVDGLDFDLHLKVKNENAIGIFADRLQYVVSIENQQVAKGERKDRIEVKSGGERVVRLPLSANYTDMKKTWARMRGKDKWQWKVDGAVIFQTPIGELSLPFEKSSSFNAPSAPEVRFLKPRISRIDLRGVTLDFDVHIKNKNSFALPSGVADIQIEMMKQTFAKNTVEIPSVAKNSSKIVKVSQRLSAKDLKKTLMRALAKPTVSAKMTGMLKAGPIEQPLNAAINFRR